MGTLGREGGYREHRLPFFPGTDRDVEGVGGSLLGVGGRHHELLREAECGDFPQQW